ncbi:MAG TPA: hypothetical protein VGJ39_01900 [Vicinamibacterales bacterium]|jgi:hypothetical protein
MLIEKERSQAYVPERRRAKTLEWDPQTDIPWEELHLERYSAEQLLAAQMYWSRRTWGEYGAISESPALLLRFCLERRLPDLQFFFTMRDEMTVFPEFLKKIRKRMAPWRVNIPMFHPPRLGKVSPSARIS